MIRTTLIALGALAGSVALTPAAMAACNWTGCDSTTTINLNSSLNAQFGTGLGAATGGFAGFADDDSAALGVTSSAAAAAGDTGTGFGTNTTGAQANSPGGANVSGSSTSTASANGGSAP